MAAPRIFIPNAQSDTPSDALKRVGLGGLLFDRDWPIGRGEIVDGPEKMRGLCVSWETTIQRPGVQAPRYEFSAERDIAHRAPAEPTLQLAEGRFWLLIEPGRPVTPNDLKRMPAADKLRGAIASAHDPQDVIQAKSAALAALTYYAGNDVTLGDGNTWTLPNMTKLPCEVAYQPATSQWGMEVAGEVRPLYDRMLVMFEACQRHITHEFASRHTSEQLALVDFEIDAEPLDDFSTALPFVCEMLALNYRLTPWIIDRLGLLKLPTIQDRSVLWECLCAITDARALRTLYQTLEKKSDQLKGLGSPSSSGDKAS